MLRKATLADVPAIKVVRSSVLENALTVSSKTVDSQYDWFVTHQGVSVWEERGDVIGFSAADPRNGNIWALFVAPGFEGRGIGSALLAEACACLRAAGLKRAWLTTDPETRAEQFYLVAGWKRSGQRGGELLFERSL